GRHLAPIIERYRHVTDVRFVQDEPKNQGPWPFISVHLPVDLKKHLPDYDLRMRPVTRPWSSAPSVGSAKVHKEQEDLLLTTALD
ncbi:MAG TPA: hypothetical protein PKA93_13145, partial [Arachnia sp.]|nr:hypothetical protein [Arachnia sp.]